MAAKKKVLGVDPLSWIKKTENIYVEESRSNAKRKENRNLEVPKYRSYEVKLTVRLSEDHLEFLSSLEREIMKNRSRENRKERITKNSIIRSIIDVFRNLDYEKSEVSNEEELTRRIREGLKNYNI